MDSMTNTALPQLTIPNHTWRWFNPQGGQPLSTTCIQLIGPSTTTTTPVATIRRNDDGTWVAVGQVNGMSGIIAGGWQASLTVDECAAAIAAHLAPVPAKATAPTLPKHVLRLALKIYREMTASYAAYEAACEQDRRAGYTAHYCEHGTNRWTDYDNICGPCEDGYTLRTPTARRLAALEAAKERHADAKRLLAWARQATDHGMYSDEFQASMLARYESLMGV